ncbi:IQ motif and SEC7 domain-containing protein 1-like isoform X4 [Tachypleus tridentatus]|uniref:IQ motif and SEC7 domain-containing protein 1-like isoform X4 n=1 Tax=Tachypleus tridentatus TaxID=6853 RepID=UPI003FD5AC9F
MAETEVCTLVLGQSEGDKTYNMTDIGNQHETSQIVEKLKANIEEKEKLIRKQFLRIEELQNEATALKQEKDALLCDISKLKFELEMSELKRLRDSTDNGENSNLTQKTTEGIPVTQPKSYSVTTSPNFNPSKTLTRQRSSSGSLGGKKTPPWRIDDKTLKRTRLSSNQYELSQDLQDKQVEMLERKYGGVCARKAALTIQRAFRKHCMNRRFQELADYVKRERQVSRRFTTTDSEVKVWMHSDDRKCRSCTSQDDTFYGADNNVRVQRPFTYTDAIHRSTLLREFSEECHRLSSPTHQLGPTERRVCLHNHQMDFRYHPKSFPERGSLCGDVLNRVSCDDFVFVPATSDDNSLYYTPPMGVRPSPAIPRHPAWTAIPRSGGKTFTHLNSGPDLLLSPSQSTPSGGVLERYYTPTQSLSSEDSAISSGAGEPCVDFLQDGQRQLYPASLTRQILTVPSEYTPQWQTPVRSANRKITPPYVEQEIALTQGFRRISSLPVQEIRTFNKSPIRSSQVSSTNYNSRESSLDYNQSPAMNNNSEVSERTKQSIKKVVTEASPIWKRKALVVAEQTSAGEQLDDKRLSNISETSEDSLESASYSTVPPVSSSESFVGQNYSECCRAQDITTTTSQHKTQVSDLQRKRQYRVGLNLFNKKPEKGISYLIQNNFLEPTAKSVARFLISRKGLSKQNIGEYLGNLQNGFNSAVLESFVEEIDLAGMQVDVALRKYQTFFRMPGEAQKIERLIEVFSRRYSDCNHDIVSKFQNPDTVFVLAFAIIMLNTDLHTPNMKADKRMKLEDFIKNLRAIDDGHDLDRDMLSGIYERIKVSEFKTGSDHMTQVMKVQQTIVGKKPNLAQPHRRLVCYCRLYEVYDINKKERAGIHQREVFLFNDMLMVSKIFSKKKTSITYTFRQSFPLCGINVTLFEAPYYPHGIRLTQRVDNKVLITFNARNEHDRTKFVDDLKESILEMDEMENLRIETELEKQKSLRNRVPENRDSGVADIEIFPTSSQDNNRLSPDGQGLNMKHSALSNSLLDLHDPQLNKPVRRGSAGSLDSGMSVSFQSSAASTGSQDSSSQMVSYSGTNDVRNISESVVPPGTLGGKSINQQSFLGGLFGKKSKSSSKGSVVKTTESTDV